MNNIVSCPFNRLHRVSKARLQHHIIKCMPNYPKFVQCVYNSLHWFETKEEMREHMENCPSQRLVIEQQQENSCVNVIGNSLQESRKFHLKEENWDEEYP